MLVSICCLSFNHGKYIKQALDGFLSQNFDHEFEIIVHDDCSTDDSLLILNEYESKYPETVRVIRQEINQYSQGKRVLYEYLFPAARGKYIAFCECDDYWISPQKLDIQVAYMEKNPDCSLTFTATNILDDKGIIREFRPSKGDRDFSLAEIIGYPDGGLIPTATMVFKRELIYGLPSYCWKAPIGDWPLSVYLASKGKVHYFDYVSSVYRFNHPGSWTRTHGEDKYIQTYRKDMMECLKDMMEKFCEPEKTLVKEKYEIQEYEYLVETGNVLELFKKYKKKTIKTSAKNWIRIIYRVFRPKY